MGLSLGLSLSAAPLGALAAPPAAADVAQPSDVEPEAVQALQRMSAYLGTLNSFEIKAETSLDLVTDDDRNIRARRSSMWWSTSRGESDAASVRRERLASGFRRSPHPQSRRDASPVTA